MIQINTFKKCPVNTDLIKAFALSIPNRDFDPSKSPFGFLGWIVGKEAQCDRIEVIADGLLIQDIPVTMKRPDVAALYPGCPGKEQLGFFSYYNPFLLSPDFTLEICGVFRGHEKQKLFEMSGQRSLPTEDDPMNIQPLVVTSLGRTGSTLAIATLGSHPQITAYRPYQAEARYASYWTQIFLNQSDPKSWICPIGADNTSKPDWVLGHDLSRPAHFALYPEMVSWFSSHHLKALYAFCMESLNQHYEEVSRVLGKQDPVYFCEKFLPVELTEALLRLAPGAKEIFLVRDFRDMFCSIQAFNRKRGYQAFGRELFAQDEEYISTHLKASVERLSDAWRMRGHQAYLLRYEDLIQNQEATLKAVFDFLKIDASPKTVHAVIKQSLDMHPESQSRHQTSLNPQSSMGRHKNELSAGMLALCNQAFGPALKMFGYVP